MINSPNNQNGSQNRNSQDGRPSIQDLMKKYSSPPRQENLQSQQFEFDAKQIQSQFMYMGRDSLPSQLYLNDYSMQSDQNASMPAYQQAPVQFQNPFSTQVASLTIQKPPQQDDRVTFGQNSNHSGAKQLSLSPIQRLPNNAQEVTTSQFVGPEEELYDEMNVLKVKVLGMIQTYSMNLKNLNNKKVVQQGLKSDALVVAKEYSIIIEKFNHGDTSNMTDQSAISQNPAKELELQMMFNLVDKFLNKFQSSSLNTSSYQGILKQRMEKSRLNLPLMSPEKTTTTQIKNFQHINTTSPKKDFQYLQIQSTQSIKDKIIYDIGGASTDRRPTFDRFSLPIQTSLAREPIQTEILEMSVLPRSTYGVEDSFYVNQNISTERLNRKLRSLQQKLTIQLQAENLPLTKRILSEMIDNLNTLVGVEDELLVKTMAFKIEEGIKQMTVNKEGSMKLYTYLSRAIRHSQQKAMMYRNSEPLYVGRGEQDQQTRFTEQQQQSLKRQFFDLALARKHTLSSYHAGKNVMVSDLWDRFVGAHLPQNQMEAFIVSQLSNYKV